jgi:uncharacterized membrane protein (DUF4010 family)
VESYEPFLSLGVAVGIGLLVGFERERAARSADEARELTAGARTYPLIALAGALSVLIGRAAGWWIVLPAMLAAVAPLIIAFWFDAKSKREHGGTSEAAALVVFLLGALSQAEEVLQPVEHRLIVSSSIGVLVTLLLSVKMPLHRFLAKTSRQDVFATLKFLVVAAVVLPLLPDRTYGPLDVLNPFEIGLMIALIAGIGFVGYVATRIVGPDRGIAITGIVGGLASSTAVTLAFSGRARTDPHLRGACSVAVILASTIMFVRVIVEVAVVNRDLLPRVVVPFSVMTVVAGIAAGIMYWRDTRAKENGGEPMREEVELSNPVELSAAVKFGLLYGGVLLASKAADTFLGTGGTYVAALVAGLTDVDAITLSMAKLAREGLLSETVAVRAILIGTASNTAVKAGLAVVLGGFRFGRVVLAAFVAALVAGGVTMVFF